MSRASELTPAARGSAALRAPATGCSRRAAHVGATRLGGRAGGGAESGEAVCSRQLARRLAGAAQLRQQVAPAGLSVCVRVCAGVARAGPDWSGRAGARAADGGCGRAGGGAGARQAATPACSVLFTHCTRPALSYRRLRRARPQSAHAHTHLLFSGDARRPLSSSLELLVRQLGRPTARRHCTGAKHSRAGSRVRASVSLARARLLAALHSSAGVRATDQNQPVWAPHRHNTTRPRQGADTPTTSSAWLRLVTQIAAAGPASSQRPLTPPRRLPRPSSRHTLAPGPRPHTRSSARLHARQ